MAIRPRYRRSDLFLVRLAAKEATDGSGQIEWHGKVQRAVDGESHPFQSLAALMDLLQQMVSNYEGR